MEMSPMFDPKAFEEFNSRISAMIAASPAKDLEKNTRALMNAFFTKIDLVTREEFDLQAHALARAQEKLAALEARVEALEHAARNRADAG
jgi:BMFP domain-containing protein YqiC